MRLLGVLLVVLALQAVPVTVAAPGQAIATGELTHTTYWSSRTDVCTVTATLALDNGDVLMYAGATEESDDSIRLTWLFGAGVPGCFTFGMGQAVFSNDAKHNNVQITEREDGYDAVADDGHAVLSVTFVEGGIDVLLERTSPTGTAPPEKLAGFLPWG